MDAYIYSTYPSYSSFKSWNEMNTMQYKSENSNQPDIIFKTNSEFNEKIILWCGDISKLQIQAVVLSINNFMDNKHSPNVAKLAEMGGNKYAQQFLSKVSGCKTGEIRMIESYDIPSNYVLHTVSPKFNVKYESAAINALYNCYRNALMCALDKGIESIAFQPLHISKYPFPDDLAIHLEARILRRFLEKHSDKITAIVVNLPNNLMSLYEKIFPLYFPRNQSEELYSADKIPRDIGNENGQPILPERSIRISAFPYGPTRKPDSDEDEDDDDDQIQESFNEQDPKNADSTIMTHRRQDSYTTEIPIDPNENLTAITSSGCHRLTQTHIPPAILRQSMTSFKEVKGPSGKKEADFAKSLKTYEKSLANERKFDRLFRQSRTMDFSAWNELKVFYQCGKDINEDPIFLVVEKNLPNTLEEYRADAFSYIIWMLEKHVPKGRFFSVIYAHTLSNCRPTKEFFVESCQLLNHRYYKQLRYICMVHGSFINRTMNWVLTNFTLPELKIKMINIFNLRQLYRIIDPILLELPEFIYDYDKNVGGRNSYNTVSRIPQTSGLSSRSNPSSTITGNQFGL